MRILASLLTTLMIFQVAGTALATEGQVECQSLLCVSNSAAPTSTMQSAQETRNTVTSQMAAQVLFQSMEHYGIEKSCKNFATENGYGDWAKYIYKSLRPDKYPNLFDGTDDIRKACPGFNAMDADMKKHFYVYFFTHLTFVESSCNVNANNIGPSGESAYGLLALHLNREAIYTQYSLNKCVRGDAKKALTSLRCGMAMMDGQFSKREELYSRKSYWGPLTPQTRLQTTVQPLPSRKNVRVNANRYMKTVIKNYPFCK